MKATQIKPNKPSFHTNKETAKMTNSAKLQAAIDGMPASISPYHLAQLATAVVGRKVYGPMVYTLVNKGYINGFKDAAGKTKISQADAIEWLSKYVNKTGGRTPQMQGLLNIINEA